MNKKIKILLIKNIIIFILYFLLFIAIPNLYFEMPRIRLASVLSLIVLFDMSYIYGVSLAIVIINFFSPLGVCDYIISSILSIVALLIATKYIFPKCNYSVFKSSLVMIIAGIGSVIAMSVHYIEEINIISKILHTFAGDFIVLSLFGSLLFYSIRDTKIFKLITKK